MLIENWRRHSNAVRPHSSLGYRPPAAEAILPPALGLPKFYASTSPRVSQTRRALTLESVSLQGVVHGKAISHRH